MGRTMHRDQVATDVGLVRALLADQLPHLAGLPVEPVSSWGTDHDVYRLGDHLAVRLPKIAWAHGQCAFEARWLPLLAPHLPVALPCTAALGAPGCGYPFDWAVVEWLPGRQCDPDRDATERAAADLGAVVTALRALPDDLAPAPPVRGPGRRGGPLAALDDDVRAALAELGARADVVVGGPVRGGGGRAVLRCWEAALEAPEHSGPPAWAHGDLMPGNLLVDAGAPGRLTAVIDWGSFAMAADPATDLLPAWHVFGGAPGGGAAGAVGRAQALFREAVGADDAAWARGRGVVVHQAVQALPYYWDTNPGMVAQASRALAAAVTETA